jgi:hypothetical protein
MKARGKTRRRASRRRIDRFPDFAPRGFNRHFASNRFGLRQFDRFCFSRFGFNRFDGNQLVIRGWGWGGVAFSTGASEPIIVRDGAPVVITIGADPAPSNGAAGYAGAASSTSLSTRAPANMSTGDKSRSAD